MMLRKLLVATFTASMAACGGAPGPADVPTTGPGDASSGGGDAAAGEKLFAELGCKGCHGSRGEPGGVGPNLFAITWNPAEEAEARETILKGRPDHKPPMPKYEGQVDEKKMADLLAFVRNK